MNVGGKRKRKTQFLYNLLGDMNPKLLKIENSGSQI